MRKNLSVEREFEREIVDHAAFLRDEEERAQLEYELECEYAMDYWEGEDYLPEEVECPAGWESI
jgi:hypothetical protein